jgi:hypothetical protein
MIVAYREVLIRRDSGVPPLKLCSCRVVVVVVRKGLGILKLDGKFFTIGWPCVG